MDRLTDIGITVFVPVNRKLIYEIKLLKEDKGEAKEDIRQTNKNIGTEADKIYLL